MKSFTSVVALVALVAASANAVAIPDNIAEVCKPGTEVVHNSTDIEGKPLTFTTCDLKEVPAARSFDEGSSLEKRAAGYDLCGAPCTTVCHGGTGGPNPNDCQTLANNHANDGEFTVSYGTFGWWTYGSCAAGLANHWGADVYYCWDTKNLAGVISYLAWNCQSTQHANGGQCNFNNNPNGLGYVIVETS
ncbi:hypothetical protein PsYK624_136470 [Phanerochaete sordida]|uniref:Cyanovirin-N domain-containing protein n=1 Tax=Phanerochaete sordida TaxID=48140 RepID=A0A9P3GK83_9APHY|nr:hypothetical protein PsYK624_136470 [Phanerochaete sordida]